MKKAGDKPVDAKKEICIYEQEKDKRPSYQEWLSLDSKITDNLYSSMILYILCIFYNEPVIE